MKRNTIFKLFTSAALLITTVIFAILGNQVIFPSTLVGFLLVLTLLGTEEIKRTAIGRAARNSIVIFSVIVITLNIIVSIFLPALSTSSDLSGYSVELTTSIGTTDKKEVENHFVAVTINDMHELCYTTSILLLINVILLSIYRFKKRTIY